MSDRRVDSWALARMAASLARISLSEIPSWRSSVTSRRIVLASSRATRSEGSSNGVRASSSSRIWRRRAWRCCAWIRRFRASCTASRSSSRLGEPDRVQERRVDLGEPHLLEVVQPDFHRHGRAPQRGLARRGPQLGLGLTRLARRGSDQRLAQPGDRAVAEPHLRLEAELDLLDLVEHAAVRAVEHQVGRDVIAQLRGPFELGHDLAVPLEVPLEVGLDVGLADRPHRALQREALVVRQGRTAAGPRRRSRSSSGRLPAARWPRRRAAAG